MKKFILAILTIAIFCFSGTSNATETAKNLGTTTVVADDTSFLSQASRILEKVDIRRPDVQEKAKKRIFFNLGTYIVLGYRDPLGYSVEGRFAKQKNLSLLGVRGIYDFAGNHVFITPFLGAEFGVINDSKNFCHKGSMYGPMVGVRKELKEIPFTLTTDFGVYKISMANTVASVDDWQFIVNCDVSFSLETFLNYFKR